MKFSNRERFLIGFLLLMIIWAVAYSLFIAPGRERLIRTQELRDILEEERAVTDLYLSNYHELEDQLKEMEESHETEDFFFRDIDDTYMDSNLQDMAKKAGVSIERMAIGEASGAKLDGSSKKLTDIRGESADRGGGQADSSGGLAGRSGGSADSSGMEEERSDVMETIVTLEVASPDIEGVMAFTEELYQERKSLSVSYLDMENEYGRDSDGQEVLLGMKGIMEVIYYYEETR